MTEPIIPSFQTLDLDAIAAAPGWVVVFIPEDGRLDRAARRVNLSLIHI